MSVPNAASTPSPQADISQLKDIHLPATISDWPIAFGWWSVLILTVFSIISGIYLWRYYKAKHANKNAALSLLALTYKQYNSNQDSHYFLQQSNQILKRYCLKQYPAAVSLSGLVWTDFLISHSKKTFFNENLAHALSLGIYQADYQYNADELYQACTSWLKNNKTVETTTVAIDVNTGHSND